MQEKENIQRLEELVTRFITLVSKRLPDDVSGKLSELQSRETNPMAQAIYQTMFDNIELALALDRPVCQDTGVLQFFPRAGTGFPYLGAMETVLRNAVRDATVQAPLRHNAVETFDEFNTGDNTGRRVPWVDWEVVPGDSGLSMDVYMAGGGCTLPGTAKVLMPSAGFEGIVDYVLDAIVSYGVNACPPLLVGVGIATSVDTAAVLSKKALMRKIGSRNPNAKAAKLEALLTDGINRLGIGPQGLSGDSSVMGVHVEHAARHPSAIGVAINVGCWAHRRGSIRFSKDLSYEILTHSMRMERFEKEFVRQTGVRLLIGKGGMGPETEQACEQFKALHLVFPGGCAVVAANCVKAIERVEWQELGMPEALWVCRVKEFGPLIVSIDTHGNNLFQKNKNAYEASKNQVAEEIKKQVAFIG